MSTKKDTRETFSPELLGDPNDLNDDVHQFDSGELTQILTECTKTELIGAVAFLLGYFGPDSQYDAEAAYFMREFVRSNPKFQALVLDIPGIAEERSRLEH